MRQKDIEKYEELRQKVINREQLTEEEEKLTDELRKEYNDYIDELIMMDDMIDLRRMNESPGYIPGDKYNIPELEEAINKEFKFHSSEYNINKLKSIIDSDNSEEIEEKIPEDKFNEFDNDFFDTLDDDMLEMTIMRNSRMR